MTFKVSDIVKLKSSVTPEQLDHLHLKRQFGRINRDTTAFTVEAVGNVYPVSRSASSLADTNIHLRYMEDNSERSAFAYQDWFEPFAGVDKRAERVVELLVAHLEKHENNPRTGSGYSIVRQALIEAGYEIKVDSKVSYTVSVK